MPDLSEQLAAILSNPEAQKNIRSLLSSFGGGNAEPSAPPKETSPGNFFGGNNSSGSNDMQNGLQSLLSSLGGGNSGGGNSGPGNNDMQKGLQSLLSSLGGGNSGPSAPPKNNFLGNLLGGDGGPGLNMETLIKIQKVFSAMNQDDKDISLLRALRPHLKEPGRVDEAIRILQLISVLPALGESGLFGGGWH